MVSLYIHNTYFSNRKLTLMTGCKQMLMAINSSRCASYCPGNILIFECTVLGGGSTVFGGSAVICNDIILLHSLFNTTNGTSKSCENKTAVGQSLSAEDSNCYTSQLNITVTSDVYGRSINCYHDNGTTEKLVGSHTIPVPSTTTHTGVV